MDTPLATSSELSVRARSVTIMPSSLHETLIEIFRVRPALVATLLGGPLGQVLPRFEQARVEPGELTDVAPTEYRADTVVTLSVGDEPVLAIVIEVQLRRDPDKRWTWPIYLTTLRGRLRCPAVLVVVCLDQAVAVWCAAPIQLGHPGATVAPLVLGPDRMPVVTGADQAAATPELAVLSAIIHGADPRHRAVLDALPGALSAVDLDHAALYYDVVLTALPQAASRYLEALMTTSYEYQSDFARRYFSQGRAEGEAKGEAKAVLAFLDARGITVSDDVRARIAACTDLDQLDTWVRRAATATTSQD
ncbi:MAG: hypothetical protein ACRDRU_28825, partial [Pseudonocardiaceae bacterium]